MVDVVMVKVIYDALGNTHMQISSYSGLSGYAAASFSATLIRGP